LADRAAIYAATTRAIQGAAGLVTAVFIFLYFSPAEQGYYYTFSSLLALQIFVELGLSTIITTFAAHEWAKLSLDHAGAIGGDPRALSRLQSLARQVFLWYLIGAALLLPILAVAGGWMFTVHGDQTDIPWVMPWLAMCVLTFLAFVLTPAWAFLTGCGQLASLNAYKLIETVLRYAVLWICMSASASLWSLVGALAFTTVASYLFLAVRHRSFFSSVLSTSESDKVSWKHELAPLQIRIAISWLSGYFAFSLFTPAVFYFLGPERAGQMGMSWAIISGLSGVAGAWLQVQSPSFAMMVAKGEFAKLDKSGTITALIGPAVFSIGALVVVATLYALELQRSPLISRLLPLGAMAVFLLAEFLHQISMYQSTYLRAFKQEPFMYLSVTSSITIAAGTLLLTPRLEAYGPALGYLAGVTIALIWGTLIFTKHRRIRSFFEANR
jgi:O-antigen/teichoic acid export membrane protein